MSSPSSSTNPAPTTSPTPPIIDRSGSNSPRRPASSSSSKKPTSSTSPGIDTITNTFSAPPPPMNSTKSPSFSRNNFSKKQAKQKSIRRKVIIDTDCGGDDALGILVAATDPSVDLVMLSAVWGNCEVHQGVENLGKLVDVTGKDIPIFVGAEGPLLGHERETSQWYGYGDDGFGDAGFDHSQRADRAERSGKHAALAIVETLNEVAAARKKTKLSKMLSSSRQKESSSTTSLVENELKEEDEDENNTTESEQEEEEVWQLICLGPLTNIATALQLQPNLFANLGSVEHEIPGVIIMGGAMQGKGNANLCSEFNFASDPEAARTVFNNKSSKIPHLVITWELTVDLALPWEVFDKMLGRNVNNNSTNQATSFPSTTTEHHVDSNTNVMKQKQQQNVQSPFSVEENRIIHDDEENENSKSLNEKSSGTCVPDDDVEEKKDEKEDSNKKPDLFQPSANTSFTQYPPLSSHTNNNNVVRNPRLQSFLKRLLKKFEDTSRPEVVETGDQERTQDSCVICDAVCVAIALNTKKCLVESNKTYATVELHGADTRGALCIDWYGNEQSRRKKGRWVNAEVVLKAKHDVVNEIIGGITLVVPSSSS